MQKTPLTILINRLLILSLLLPFLTRPGADQRTQPTPTQTVEPSPTSAPLLTPTPEPIPATPSTTHTVIATTFIVEAFEWSDRLPPPPRFPHDNTYAHSIGKLQPARNKANQHSTCCSARHPTSSSRGESGQHVLADHRLDSRWRD